MSLTRRQFLWTTSGCAAVAARAPATAPVWRAKQYHNQPEDSHQQTFLVRIWDAVRRETRGRLDVSVHARNEDIPGSDPQALSMLVSGDLQFFTVMGGILGNVVPAAEIQGLPFAFSRQDQVHRLNDGALGVYLGAECAAKGIHRFQYGLLENGFRQIAMIDKPIRRAGDLAGVRMRVPDAELFRDLFRAFEAEPITVNLFDLYDALKTRHVDGQENPLVVTEFNRLYEVTRYQSITNHMWSGFNLLANSAFWLGLPDDVRRVVDRHVRREVMAQRAHTDRLNRELQSRLRTRGQIFNHVDPASFRRALGGDFYRRLKQRFGGTAWGIVEREIGRLV